MVTAEDFVWKSYLSNEDNYGSANASFEHEYHTQHFGSDDMEMSYAPPMSNSSKKRKAHEMSESNATEAIMKATILLKEIMVEIEEKLSESIGTEERLEKKAEDLDAILDEIQGLIEDERDNVLSKILEYPSQKVVFFYILHSQRLRCASFYLPIKHLK
ncbi:hypothetical protein PTKIN_Ptkin13bG0160000 [Pterospermum kingtungense]